MPPLRRCRSKFHLLKSGREALDWFKIGLPIEFYQKGSSPAVENSVQAAIEKFKELGAEMVEVLCRILICHSGLLHRHALGNFFHLARFDGIKYGFSEPDAKNLLKFIPNPAAKVWPRSKRRIMLGTYALSAGYRDAYYLQAQKVRTKIKEEMDAVLKEVDILLTPTQPTAAFKIGEHTSDPWRCIWKIFMCPVRP